MTASTPNITFDSSAGATEPPKIDYDRLYAPRQTIEPLADLHAIGPEQIEQFHRTGFLSVAGVISQEQLESARAALVDLIMERNLNRTLLQFESFAEDRLQTMGPGERQDAVRKLMKFTHDDERLRVVAEDAEILSLLRRLLGDRAPRLFQDMALLKPPRGREKPWHQDKAYFDVDLGEPVVGVWLALDDASPENGCMHVIPGSHREGPSVHFKRRDWQICDTSIELGEIAAAPLPAGGAMFFDGLLQHGTPPNRTDARRRALQLHYAPDDAVWRDTEYRLSHFGEEGKDVEC